jgi:hypothetical protein
MAQLGALQNTSDTLGVNESDIAGNLAIPGFSVPSVPAYFRAIRALSARIWAQSGRICTNCNRAIGYFCDDPARMVRAAKYLEG